MRETGGPVPRCGRTQAQGACRNRLALGEWPGPGSDSAAHGRVTQVRRACRWYGNTVAHQGRLCCTWS